MRKAKNLPDIDLERLSLGELPNERTAAAEAALTAPDTAARLEALRRSDEEILTLYPPRVMALQIEERLRAGSRSRSRARILLPSLAAAAAAAALLVFTFAPLGPDAPTERIKRPETSLLVFRKGEENSLPRGEQVREGDVVQLKYYSKGAAYGVIFSIDGRGTVTLHYPSEPTGSTALDPKSTKSTVALGYSYELDDAPRFERFFFVTSNAPLDVEEILDKARRMRPAETAALPLEAGLNQCDFVLKKNMSTN